MSELITEYNNKTDNIINKLNVKILYNTVDRYHIIYNYTKNKEISNYTMIDILYYNNIKYKNYVKVVRKLNIKDCDLTPCFDTTEDANLFLKALYFYKNKE